MIPIQGDREVHLHDQHHNRISHLPRAEDEHSSSDERQDARKEDEGVPVVKVGRLRSGDKHGTKADDRCPHLLKLLLSGEVEDEADDEGDAHDEEEDGADDVDHQVQSEVAHFGDLEQMLFVRLSLTAF